MQDYGVRKTDLRLKRLEARIGTVYKEASKDISKKLEDFEKRHAARDKRYRQQLAEGKIAQADYEAWLRGQVFQREQWKNKKASIESTLYNADKAALKMVNDSKVGPFIDNANYMGYQLEDKGKLDIGFSLYDESTVSRLIKDNPDILPPKTKVQKDKAYKYYNKTINSCITQGIIQGESIREIAKRISSKTGETMSSAMMRNARTAYTGAQNAGRIEGLHQAQRLGINVQKRWLATLDSRTRDAHASLDGQVQNVDDPFENEYGPIMYPGDPDAAPANVWNCRCTLTYVYPEYPSKMQRRDNETGEIVGDMTYREWEQMKQGGGEAPEVYETSEVPEIRDSLIGAYNYHSEHNGLNRNSAEDSIAFSEKMGNPSQFDADLSKLDEAGRENISRAVNDLCSQYDTSLSTIRMMTGEEALGNRAFASTAHNYETDTCEIKINPIKCGNTEKLVDRLRELRDVGYIPKGLPDEKLGEYVFTHEFGHSILTMEQPLDNKRNWVNADYGKIRSARREINKIYGEYAQEVGRLDGARKSAEMDFMLNLDMEAAEKAKKIQAELDRVKVSGYSLTNADEFVAESFAATRFGATESDYARRCVDVLDRYFGR